MLFNISKHLESFKGITHINDLSHVLSCLGKYFITFDKIYQNMFSNVKHKSNIVLTS